MDSGFILNYSDPGLPKKRRNKLAEAPSGFGGWGSVGQAVSSRRWLSSKWAQRLVASTTKKRWPIVLKLDGHLALANQGELRKQVVKRRPMGANTCVSWLTLEGPNIYALHLSSQGMAWNSPWPDEIAQRKSARTGGQLRGFKHVDGMSKLGRCIGEWFPQQ